MAKRVLGNDPFRRGAADRGESPPTEAPSPPARKAGAKKAGAKKAAARKVAKKSARAAAPPAREELPSLPAPPLDERTPRAEAPTAAVRSDPDARERAPSPSGDARTAAHDAVRALTEAAPLTLEPEARAEAGLPGDEDAARVEVEERAAAAADPGFTPPEHTEGRGAAVAAQALRLLGLAREVAGQAVSRERLERGRAAAAGLWGALRAGLGTSGSTQLDAYGRDAGLVAELRPVLDYLYDAYWRVELHGAEHLPDGPAVLVANHSGALPYDGLVLNLALGRARSHGPEPRWLVEDQVFHAPVLGTLLNRLGAVRASPENAQRLLAEGRHVAVFPEGFLGLSKPYAERYQLKRFGRGGFLKLALRAGVAVLPVAIVGAEETSPLLGRLPGGALGLPFVPLTAPAPLPAKWLVRVGAPLPLEGLGPQTADDLAEVQRLTERTREDIQGMLQALLRERRSIFAG